MENLIVQLEELTGFTSTALCKEFKNRGISESIDKSKFNAWRSGKTLLPSSVERVAAQWVIELWQNERNQCKASELWATDTKYTQILSFLTMADIVGMIKKHKAANTNQP